MRLLAKITMSLAALALVSVLLFQVPAVHQWLYERLLSYLYHPDTQLIHPPQLHKNDLLLDVRSWEEYQVSHLPDAIWVGDDAEAMERAEDAIASYKDTTAQVVLYCSIGLRSDILAQSLQKTTGEKTIYNLYGGLFSWANEGRLLHQPSAKPTSKVHPFDAFWGIWVRNGQKAYHP